VLERSVLELIEPERNVSIEREIWPRLVGDGLYGFAADAYWLDIGTPERYLQGTFDILEGNVATAVATRLGPGYLAVGERVQAAGRIVPPALVDRGCAIAAGAHVGSLVVLGEGVRVGEGTTIERAVVLNGAEIGAHCVLRDCIVAAGVRIGEGSTISGGAVLGEGVTVGPRNVLTRGVRVFPQTDLPEGAITF
jgi:mannose-1-phosphate guanylyltransferase